MNTNIQYKCKVENKSPISRELTISIEPESIKEYVEKQFSKIQKKVKLKGFRPGKVPMSMIRTQFVGDAKSDAFSAIVQDSYVKALVDNKINAIGNPKIEAKSGATLNDGEALTYVATVEIYPEIKIGDYSKVKVTKPSIELEKDEVQKTIKNLQQSHAEISTDELKVGPVKDEDFIELSFSGTIDGKSDPSLNGEHRMLKVGAGQYLDGFEKNILGMKKDETKTFKMTFPKDYHSTEYANKEVEFTVTIHEFKQEKLPELNDDFAKQFKAESMSDLKSKIEEDIKKHKEKKSKATFRERLIDELVKLNSFEVPVHFINMQMDHLVQENAKTLMQQGFTEKMIRDFLEKNKDDLKNRAEKQVKASLILDRAAQDFNVKIEDADLEHEFSKLAKEENMSIEDVKKYFQTENALRELRFRMKEDRTFDLICEKIKITIEK